MITVQMEGKQKQKIRWLLNKTSSLISDMIMELSTYYRQCDLLFQFSVDHVHQIIMTLLVPVQLKAPDSVLRFSFQQHKDHKNSQDVEKIAKMQEQQHSYNQYSEQSQQENKQKDLYQWVVTQISNGKELKRNEIKEKVEQLYANFNYKKFYEKYPKLNLYFYKGRQTFLNELLKQKNSSKLPKKITLTRMQARKQLQKYDKTEQEIQSFIKEVDKHNKNCIPISELQKLISKVLN